MNTGQGQIIVNRQKRPFYTKVPQSKAPQSKAPQSKATILHSHKRPSRKRQFSSISSLIIQASIIPELSTKRDQASDSVKKKTIHFGGKRVM